MLVQVDERGGACIKHTQKMKRSKEVRIQAKLCMFELLFHCREVLVNTTTQLAVPPCQYSTFRSFGLFALIEYMYMI